MRIAFLLLLCSSLTSAFAQIRYDEYYDYDSYLTDEEAYNLLKYPYATGNSPEFIGLVAGYGFSKTHEVELGLAVNVVEGPTDFGVTGGYQLVYRRSLERDLNAVDLEIGVYGLLTLGIGTNYNFSKDVSAWGFKPFIGTSIYHFQLIYSYNFVRKTKREWFNLPQHSFRIRYVLPLAARRESYYSPPPAPHYQNLPGLHKGHPEVPYNENRIRNDIQLR